MIYFCYDRFKKDMDQKKDEIVFITESFVKSLNKLDSMEYQDFKKQTKKLNIKFMKVKHVKVEKKHK